MSQLLREVEQRTSHPIGHRLNPFASMRLSNLRKKVRGLARKCLEDRQKDPHALANRKDLLNMMLTAQDPETGAKMSEEEIVSENVLFLVAGHDTTAHSMSWFLYHTAQYPEWQKKVQEEVDAVLKNKELPEYEDLSKMTVLDMVLKESMRMTSSTPSGSVRELKTDMQIGEFFVPKGTALWVNIHALNHNPRVWPDHDEFNPNRFANNQAHYPKFIPFSSGPRNCIGQTFAKVEMRAVLSTMAKHFEWKLDESKPVVPTFAVTQKPKGGLFVYLTPRH